MYFSNLLLQLLLVTWNQCISGDAKTSPTKPRRTYRTLFKVEWRNITINENTTVPGLEHIPQPEIYKMLKKVRDFLKNDIVADEPYLKKTRQHNAVLFMDRCCNKIESFLGKAKHFAWIYEANINDFNKMNMIKAKLELENATKRIWQKFRNFQWTDELEDKYYIPRYYYKVNKLIGDLILPQKKLERYRKLQENMEDIYNNAKVCKYKEKRKCDLTIDSDLGKIFATSRNPKELKYYWIQWRSVTGNKLRRYMFEEYVNITNEVAHLNNYTDAEQMWNDNYDMKNFTEEVSRLWNEIKPLYLHLHAYVRNRLRKVYGAKIIPKKGPIPAHLLGDMWAKTWVNIYNITAPFPEAPLWNITEELVNQGYTPLKMFKLAADFYESTYLGPMSATFWDRSIFERIKNRKMNCQPSAWDFHKKHDYRIRMCTEVTYEDFLRIHHELGHVWYFRHIEQYPIIYKHSANEAFHEAFGDIIKLSVITPTHLKRIGLVHESAIYTPKMEINQLYLTALEKLAILPFSYITDLWRWDIFKYKIDYSNYNKHWWKLRLQYQGVSPPVQRTETDFDPGSMYHVLKGVPHIKYFMSIFHQFQYHRRLCNYTSIIQPLKTNARILHLCDIYKCGDCGHSLWTLMFYGSSETWQWITEASIDEWWIDAESVKEYFAPLLSWLIRENEKNKEHIGWD